MDNENVIPHIAELSFKRKKKRENKRNYGVRIITK